MFGRKVNKPVGLVTGLPPDPEDPPAAPEYVQWLRERLELAQQIVSVALFFFPSFFETCKETI